MSILEALEIISIFIILPLVGFISIFYWCVTKLFPTKGKIT